MHRQPVTMQVINLFRILLLALPIFATQSLLAQQAAQEVRVGEIEIEFIGVQNVNTDVVRANMQIRTGMTYTEALVDDSLRSLYGTRLFEYIDVKRSQVTEGQVDLIFRVKSKYRILAIYFDGNYKLSERRLKKEIRSRANGSLNERAAKDDAKTIHELYLKRGYTQATVDYEIERDASTGFGEITFRINEGGKVKVSDIEFIGNDNVKTKLLRKEMETRSWNWLSWILGSGKFDEFEFEEDLIKIRDYYREEGFLDVFLKEDEIEFDYSRKGKLIIRIPVEEGRQYKVGTISISGNELFDVTPLSQMLAMKEGDVFAPTLVDTDRESLGEFYGAVGYLETRVEVKRIPNMDTGAIDLEYSISESERFKVESILIEGNTKSKSVIILRELSLAPGMPFDMVRMKISKQRLDNTRWFESVEVTDEQTNIPNARNLKVSVKEGRTGNFTFGAGYSSIQQAVGFIEVSQGNFDIFNFRSFFQGDGQKLRIRIEVGQVSSETQIYFEEPFFLDNYFYQLAFGFQIFNRDSDYLSSIYSESRAGFEIFLRKRLFGIVEGRIGYRLENVDLNFFTSIPYSYRKYYGEDEINDNRNQIKSTISRLTFSLRRDMRDKILFTNKGSRVELLTQIAGGPFGGTQDFMSLELKMAKWIPIFSLGQGISVDFRTGVAMGYGDTEQTPYTEQFYLGGQYDIRGFELREVGPVDFGEPLRDINGDILVDINGNPRYRAYPTYQPKGGQTYASLTLEYFYSISEQVRASVFFDGGLVNTGVMDYSTEWYSDNVGIGITLMVMGTPLRLDYAMPIHTTTVLDEFGEIIYTNDKGAQFNFNFGTRF